ncbi:MAG: hypothetical protein KKA79_08960 [Nanoarchaeota archaeon]|nr:hypothetical protein [Nanoarchaeota archaeon]
MKRRIILILIALLLLQVASAEIILNDFGSSVYNKGEQFSIAGTILRDVAVEGGSLEFRLVCGSLKFDLPALTVNVNAKETKTFSTAFFSVPSAAEGDCYVDVFLLFDKAILEDKRSETFTISDELKADEEDFEVNPIQVQLGKTLTLYGYVTNINDEGISGSANIYFKNNDKSYYVNNVDVVDGKLEYSYNVIDNKPGEYFVDVRVIDVYGNNKLFESVAKFNIVDELYIFVEPIHKKILPGSTVQLNGEVSTILGDGVADGTMQIILGDQIFSTEIKDGKLDYIFALPEDIDTGKHTLMFSFIEIDTGNWGTTDKTLYIEAVASEIKIDTFQESIEPEQILDARIFVYDQAKEIIEEDVRVELIDSDGKTVFLDSVVSGDRFSIEIPQYSVPGTWKLEATYMDISLEKEVIVDEVSNVEVEMENETLYIHNTGNVLYNDYISIELDGGDFIFTRKVSIDPADTWVIDLKKEAPSGQYDVQVTGNAVADNLFDNTIIVGKAKRSLNIIYSFMLICVIASLVYLSVFKKIHFNNIKIRIRRDEKHAKLRLKKIKAMKDRKVSKPMTFTKEQSISDFRERVLKDIRETEDKMASKEKHNSASSSFSPPARRSFSSSSSSSSESSSEEKKKDEGNSGLFNMFN